MKAAGALAGGLLLVLTALPGHTGQLDAAVRQCVKEGKLGHACAGASLAKASRPAARFEHPRPRAQRECRGLKEAIQVSEQAERRSGAGVIESLRQDLLSLRKRYRQLGC